MLVAFEQFFEAPLQLEADNSDKAENSTAPLVLVPPERSQPLLVKTAILTPAERREIITNSLKRCNKVRCYPPFLKLLAHPFQSTLFGSHPETSEHSVRIPS